MSILRCPDHVQIPSPSISPRAQHPRKSVTLPVDPRQGKNHAFMMLRGMPAPQNAHGYETPPLTPSSAPACPMKHPFSTSAALPKAHSSRSDSSSGSSEASPSPGHASQRSSGSPARRGRLMETDLAVQVLMPVHMPSTFSVSGVRTNNC